MLLLLQTSDDEENELIRAERATRIGSRSALITILAVYPDGAPVRKATIGCEGYWFKYRDEEDTVGDEWFAFEVDARGAIVLNPLNGWGTMNCRVQTRTTTTYQMLDQSAGSVFEIVVPGNRK